MTTTRLRRSFAAVTTAVACLIMLADPAAAATHGASIDGGLLVLTKTGVTETLDLGPPPPPPSCPAGSFSVDDGTGSTLFTTALSWLDNRPIFGTDYLFVITRLTTANTSGTLNTTTQTVTNMRVALDIDVYNPANPACTVAGTLICQAAVLLNLSGTYTGTLGVGDTVSLTGSSVGTFVANPSCLPPLSGLLGTTVTIPGTDPLTLTITS